MKHLTWITSFLLLVCFKSAQADPVRIMSFNLRLPNPQDGIHDWDHRRPQVVKLIQMYSPDILGVQEAFRRQLDELEHDMPEYDWFGVCRTDGTVHPDPDNEFSAILYRRDRLERLDGSTFWLSETPEVVGSRGWDAALPRIVTWCRFKDKITGVEFFHFNTHFDHMGLRAREESASLLLDMMHIIAGNIPMVVTGDFNCEDSSAPYRRLTAAGFLLDAMHRSRMPHEGPEGTFVASFMLQDLGDRRIDYIFTTGQMEVMRHVICADAIEGRLASDHLPVWADLRL